MKIERKWTIAHNCKPITIGFQKNLFINLPFSTFGFDSMNKICIWNVFVSYLMGVYRLLFRTVCICLLWLNCSSMQTTSLHQFNGIVVFTSWIISRNVFMLNFSFYLPPRFVQITHSEKTNQIFPSSLDIYIWMHVPYSFQLSPPS